MSQSTLAQLEQRFRELPLAEQKQLLDRLAHRVSVDGDNGNEELLAQMAADPDVQREMRTIEREFAAAEADGLNHT